MIGSTGGEGNLHQHLHNIQRFGLGLFSTLETLPIELQFHFQEFLMKSKAATQGLMAVTL
jgi:hypothetical protein